MTETFDPRSISTDEYAAQISRLEKQLAAEAAAYHRTAAELKWWQDGQTLFATIQTDNDAPIETAEPVEAGAPSGSAENVVASDGNGGKPVLREAIFQVMREHPARVWKVPEVIKALEARHWMPNGANATHIVRSRLSTLTKAGELRRPDYGAYALPEGGETP